jgi:hypothetical protein
MPCSCRTGRPPTRATGTASVKAQAAAPLSLWTEERQSGRYPDETVRVIRGVEMDGKRLKPANTRGKCAERPEISAPWTRVNNCTRGGRGRAWKSAWSWGGGVETATASTPSLSPGATMQARTCSNNKQLKTVCKKTVKRRARGPSDKTRWAYWMQAIEPTDPPLTTPFPATTPCGSNSPSGSRWGRSTSSTCAGTAWPSPRPRPPPTCASTCATIRHGSAGTNPPPSWPSNCCGSCSSPPPTA